MKKGIIIGLAGGVILVIIGFFVLSNFNLNEKSGSAEPYKIGGYNKQWNRIFAKALEPVDCPEPRDLNFLPEGYYKGKMIDTHVHMQSLPESSKIPPQFYSEENIGAKNSIDTWRCMLDVEGTEKAFVFFPVWEPIVEQHIELVRRSIEEYPDRFIPFIMPPDSDNSPGGYPTVDAHTLARMLEVEPSLFRGYGEIGLYARGDHGGPKGAKELPPDSQRLMEIYPVVKEYNLLVYFHLGEGQKESLMRVAAANPDLNFIFHGDQLIDCEACDGTHKEVEEILKNNPNIYYGVDELYGGQWLLKPGANKQDFIDHFKEYGPLLEADVAKFKEFIERYQDQVLWGTDRGVSARWDKDSDIAIILNDYSRAFIGKLSPEVQEKFAYKNAERLLQRTQ